MSFHIHRSGGAEPPVVLEHAWVSDVRLSFGQLGVLVVLHAVYVTGHPVDFDELCERAGATRTALHRTIGELEALGYVRWAGEAMVVTSPYETLVSAALEAARQEAGRE